MVELLRALVPDYSHIEEHNVVGSMGEVIAYQSILMTTGRYPFSGGMAQTLNSARRICAAEAIERACVQELRSDSCEATTQSLLDIYPTSCGFAAGFERPATSFRAVCEAVERWAWSQWIDGDLPIPHVTPAELSPSERYFASAFDRVAFFQIGLDVHSMNRPMHVPQELVFSVAIGVSGAGVFPGSRVTSAKDKAWEHPLLEAWRHLEIFKSDSSLEKSASIFDRRIRAFGVNGIGQLDKLFVLSKARQDWPQAKLRIVRELKATRDYFVWRALCEDFVGWDRGDENRFIY